MIKMTRDTADIFVPDGLAIEAALARTTHMAIAAHQDDLEILAVDAILQCFQREDRWFCGVVVTDGGSAPRDGLYRSYSDKAMKAVRRKEQRKAAVVGEYGALVQLDYPSCEVQDAANASPVDDIARLLMAARPETVYTHNLADKHDTHVSVALRVIEAIRQLDAADRPERLYGCEVWRDLDWMLDSDKAILETSAHENLQMALLAVFDSQIMGGKRYDLAAMARRRANATFSAPHSVDAASGLSFAMDLTPLVQEPDRSVEAWVQMFIARFAQDVADRCQRLALASGR